MKPIITRDSYHDLRKHRTLINQKYRRIEGLVALLATCEAMPQPDTDYIRQLKHRLLNTRLQLRAMAGLSDE
jgi:hypothetical protein